MRTSLLALVVAASLGAPAEVGPSPFSPAMAPLRAGQGGSYDGTPGSGYNAATRAMLLNVAGGDTTVAKRGIPIPTRPEYGYLGPAPDGIGAVVAPIFQCLTHPITEVRFATDQTIGVEGYAAAADGILGGIASVDFFCEGNVYTVPMANVGVLPTWGGSTQARGVKHHGMFQAVLAASGFAEGEAADLYMRANPSLAGVTPRIIGPFTFFRKSAPDLTLTLDTNTAAADVPGVSYKDPRKLLTYLASGAGADLWGPAGARNTRAAFVEVICADGCRIDFATPFPANAALAVGRRGDVVFTATGTCAVANSQWAAATCNYGTISWTGWTIDIANMSSWEQLYGGTHHFSTLRHCEITSSAGIGELPGNYGVGSKARRGTFLFRADLPLALIGCWFHDCNPVDLYQTVSIGNRTENMTNDVADVGGVLASLNNTSLPFLNAGNSYRGISGKGLFTPLKAMSLAYTPPNGTSVGTFSIVGNDQNPAFTGMVRLGYAGPGTGSYDITGSHGHYVPANGARTLTLRVGGTAVQSFTYGQNGLYTFGDLIAAINAYGHGWSAGVPPAGLIATATAVPTAALFTGSISGTTLSVSAVASGSLAVGQTVFTTAGGVLTTIAALGTGSGGTGTYTLATTVINPATSFGACVGTPYLLSKACTKRAYAGDITGLGFATFTGSASGQTLTVNPDLVGTIAVGQTIFKSDGTSLPMVKAFGTGTGGAGTYLLASSGSSSSQSFQASTVIGHFDTRTLVLKVDGTPVAAFPAQYHPAPNGGAGSFYVDDYTLPNDLTSPALEIWTSLAGGTACPGLATAINAWANGNGWSASVTDPNTGALFAGTRMRMAEMCAPLSYGTLPTGVAAVGAIYAQFLDVPVGAGIWTAVDAHVDFGQSSTLSFENALWSSNYGTEMLVQAMIWGTGQASVLHVNMAYVNNAIQQTLDAVEARALFGQITARRRHAILAHNTWATHRIIIRADINQPLLLDPFSRLDGNFADSLDASTPDSHVAGLTSGVQAQIRRNVIANLYNLSVDFTDPSLPATVADNLYLAHPNVANLTLTTKDTADFPGLATGLAPEFSGASHTPTVFGNADFTPAANGPMRLPANLRLAQIPFDIEGRPRATFDMAGAVCLAA